MTKEPYVTVIRCAMPVVRHKHPVQKNVGRAALIGLVEANEISGVGFTELASDGRGGSATVVGGGKQAEGTVDRGSGLTGRPRFGIRPRPSTHEPVD